MKLIGIIYSSQFKEKVLQQRELIRTESLVSIPKSVGGDEQIVEILKEIKDVLNEIKNK